MSYITVPADTILNVAKTRIEQIYKIRQEKNQFHVNRIVENCPIRYGFLWLNSRKRTEEEAIAYLDECTPWWRSKYRYNYLDLLQKLVLLAENGDPVNIDENAAEVLWSKL